MRAGDYRHKIIVQEETETYTYGKPTEVWSTYQSLRAAVLPQRGSEYWAARSNMEGEPVIFKTHYFADITPNMRVMWDKEAYDIKSVTNVEGMNRELLIATEKIQGAIRFTYSNISIGVSGTITWNTGAYSSTQYRHKVVGGSWSTHDESDTTGVLSHSDSLDPSRLSVGNYELQVSGTGVDGYAPGWSDSISFSVSGGEIEEQE